MYCRILSKSFLLINNLVQSPSVMAVGIPTLSSLLDINILTVISKVDRTWSERSGLSKCTNKEFNSDKVITSWFLIIYT